LEPTANLTIRRVPLATLAPDPANPRSHDERGLDAIRASLARFGQVDPLVVQKSTCRVIGGHGRLAAMKALGWTECDVVELEIDDLQATALGIALNRTGDLSAFDLPALGKLLESLQEAGALDGVGFSDKEVNTLLDEIIAAEENLDGILEDGAPGLPDAATTQRGDVWVLGSHRLMCGDSASAADVDELLGGAQIHLVNTDPPYNVKVEPRSNNAIAAGLSSFTGTSHHQGLDLARHPSKAKATHDKLRPKDRPLQNDFVSDEDFARMLRAWFGNAARVLLPGRAFYIWGGYANCANYPSALAESGLYFAQAVIWVKEHPVLTRKDFMGNHEWCFYGWREGAAHQFLGPNNASDVWSVKKLNHTAMVHLTEKPVELAARAMQYSSRPGEHVLDLFGGSGSTLIAAEQTGRRAFLMELDELYADVIVDRWQKLTGKDAMLHGDGRIFAAVRAERTGASETQIAGEVPA
jgi:DNA modification methylase